MRRFLPTLLLVTILVSSLATWAPAADLAAVQAAIKAEGASWTAGHTSVSGLSPEEFAPYLQWVAEAPPEGMSYVNPIDVPKDLPSHLDWRDVNGENFMTPIKDQHPCGTCATFSSIAAFESLIMINVGNSFVEPDLSEEHVYACEGPLPYTFFHPMAYLKGSGAPDEHCMPYECESPTDRPPCADTCADWDNRVFKTTDYRMFMWPRPEQLMAAMQDGPIIAGFQVYEDFQDYTEGVYEHVEGRILGGHGVELIGYDSDEQYWIIKNSWGPDWGEAGYAKLRWETGLLAFGYQSFDITVDYDMLCGANMPPELDALEILNGDAEIDPEDPLEINFAYTDREANLRGGELFYFVDDGDPVRYEQPVRELVGTSDADMDDPVAYALAGPFAPGEHTLTVFVADLCGLESNEVDATFTVAGDVPPTDDDDDDDDDDTADDDATDDDNTDDDNDDNQPSGGDDDDDDGGCGG